MTKLYKFLFLLCCAISINTLTFAQEVVEEITSKIDVELKEELKAEIMAELRAEMQLEKKEKKREKKESRKDSGISTKPKFFGYAQAGYIWQNDNGKDVSTFKVHRVRLVLTGNISKVFDYMLQVEGFSTSIDSNKKALMTIQDMFIRAKISPALHIHAGQLPIPLSMDIEISPGALEPINFSSILYKLVCMNPITGVSHYGRDAGIMASGSLFAKDNYSLINYGIGVFNGSQMNQIDDNKSKDIIGRLTVQPWKNFKISGSFSWGQQIGYSDAHDTDGKYASLTRYVVGGYYKSDQFMVRGEYGYQYSHRATVKEEMYYILAGYNVTDKIMPIFRYDVFNNKNIKNSKQDNFLFGAVYSPIPRLRVQANYTITKYQVPDFNLGNMFELMVTGYF